MRAFFLAVSLAATAGCSGGSGTSLPTGPSPVAVNVAFAYRAQPTTSAQEAAALTCEGVSRIYPSFWGFTHATMIPSGRGEWAALFEEVPVGRQSVRIEPPLGCEPSVLTANGTTLSPEPGRPSVFAFTVHPDGSVTR